MYDLGIEKNMEIDRDIIKVIAVQADNHEDRVMYREMYKDLYTMKEFDPLVVRHEIVIHASREPIRIAGSRTSPIRGSTEYGQ